MTTPTILLLLSAVVGLSSSQTGVCYQARSYAVYHQVYVTVSGTYSYGCWWSTCYGTRYHSQLQTRSYTAYYAQFGCCGGYQQNGALHECIPVCPGCDSNHVCAAPYTCVCPEGWTGDDCSEDINECETSDICEQNCTNTNGSYSCSCTTGYSLASDLHGCLGPPQAVSVLAISPTSVKISWQPPMLDSWDGDVQLYEISCSSPSGWSADFVVSPHSRHYQLNSLTPFSNYTCCVVAETTNGPSSSSCHTNMTLEDRPLDSPENITVVNISAFDLLIEWNPPRTPNGIVSLYKIYVTYDNHSVDNITLSGSESSYVLDGLSPHQLVYVSMSASTVAGEGPLSVTVYGRTSQAVPTGVRDLQVNTLSLYQIQISWQPPETPNGILTGYEVTVYNMELKYVLSVSVVSSILNLTISDNIGPFNPYTVSVQAFTHAGGGATEVQIVFTQEGVPRKAPQISGLSRDDATTGLVSWDPLTLDDLRGFLDSYIVIYQELKRYTCADIDIESGETISVTTENIMVTDLDRTAEYCVGVAASTAAGVGNYSQGLLPLYENILFQIHFRGVHSCLQWVIDSTLEKIRHIADTISEELSKVCNCYLPADYIGDRRVICNDENPNNVVFQGRLISTRKRNVSELMQYMTQWVSTAPRVVVQGIQLVAETNCSIKLSELGDSKCVMIQDKEASQSAQDSEPPFAPIVIGTISTIALIALIVLAACGILVLQRKVKKATHTNVYDITPSVPSSGGLPMRTLENSAYGKWHKACPEEYESPNSGKTGDKNVYESPIPGKTEDENTYESPTLVKTEDETFYEVPVPGKMEDEHKYESPISGKTEEENIYEAIPS